MRECGTGVCELARLVTCNPGHISNLRSGKARPSAGLAQILDGILAGAITGITETLDVAGLPDWGSPGFRAALDQAKAGAADDILVWCPCALT